jgi:hypothetical protein
VLVRWAFGVRRVAPSDEASFSAEIANNGRGSAPSRNALGRPQIATRDQCMCRAANVGGQYHRISAGYDRQDDPERPIRTISDFAVV